MRFHAQGQEAEPGKKAPGGCRSSRARFLETPSMPRAVVSEERTDSFVLFSCGRPPARSPKVTHVPRQPFPGATSWSRRRRHHVFPAEQARAAAWWPFHPRTRGLGRPAAPIRRAPGTAAPRPPSHPAAPATRAPQVGAASLPAGPDLSLPPARPPARSEHEGPRHTAKRAAAVTYSEAPLQSAMVPPKLRTPSAGTAASGPRLIARPRPPAGTPASASLPAARTPTEVLPAGAPEARCARARRSRGKRRQGRQVSRERPRLARPPSTAPLPRGAAVAGGSPFPPTPLTLTDSQPCGTRSEVLAFPPARSCWRGKWALASAATTS